VGNSNSNSSEHLPQPAALTEQEAQLQNVKVLPELQKQQAAQAEKAQGHAEFQRIMKQKDKKDWSKFMVCKDASGRNLCVGSEEWR
jgi:hypothetical protein